MGILLGVTLRVRDINCYFRGKNCLNENIFQRDSKMFSHYGWGRGYTMTFVRQYAFLLIDVDVLNKKQVI